MHRLVAIFFVSKLFAQVELGSLVGMVNDPQGSPVAGATVEFRATTTNVKRQVTT